MNDDEFEKLFADNSEPDPQVLKNTIKSAKSTVGQKDTLTFAFVNIWVAMAELLAPMFAKIAIKNSESLNPKNNRKQASSKMPTPNGDKNA